MKDDNEYINKKILNMTNEEKDIELKRLWIQNRKWSGNMRDKDTKIRRLKTMIREVKHLGECEDYRHKSLSEETIEGLTRKIQDLNDYIDYMPQPQITDYEYEDEYDKK